MTTRLLIATVGGSPEPLAASLLHWHPARAFFIVSAETKHAITSQITPAVQTGGWADFDGGRYDIVEISNAQDFTAIVAALRCLDEKISTWLHAHPGSEIIADFTGGTKAMTAGLAVTAARWPCQISYVGGTERTKDGVGIVVSGNELIVHAQNPWDALGHLAVDHAKVLFNHGDYTAAAQLLQTTRDRMTDGARKRECQAFNALCQFFERWERFQHKDALAGLAKLQESRNDLASVLGQHHAATIQQWLAMAEVTLKQLASPPNDAATLLTLVHDLLANARRRIAEGRYDDAVARLYRALEALAQARLHARGFTDTSTIPLEKLPEPLRTEWQTRAEDGHLKLGLQDDYKLLAALGDEVAIRFTEQKLDDPQRSLLVARNSSILAHGYTPIGEDTANKLFASALTLTDVQQSTLTSFPTLH